MTRKQIALLMLSIGVISLVAANSATLLRAESDADWHARYWNNRSLAGEPVVQWYEPAIDHDWGQGPPAPGINNDNFSAKWTRNVEFPAGTYRFTATTDDGMRVWIDEQLLIDAWSDSQVRTVSADRYLSPGRHFIRVEYYDAGGAAVAKFGWSGLGGQPQSFAGWKGEYFNNSSLTAPPLFVRDDPVIDFNWGLEPPIAGFSADDFSVRWTRTLDFPAGRYQFNIRTDDGVRLWVNNQLIIDEWRDQTEANFSAGVTLPGGPVPIKLEFYDGRDKAYVMLNWTPALGTPAQPAAPASTGPAVSLSATGENTATMTGALYLNVRDEPSMEGEVIGSLARGQVVPLTGYRSLGSYWVEIELPDGSTGWVSSRFMTGSVPFSSLTIR